MSDTTSRLGLPFPELGDEADISAAVEPLALALDANAAVYGQGLLSARPAAGLAGRFWRASDTKLLYYDNGVAWESVPAPNTVTPLMLTDAFMAVPRTAARWHNYNPGGWFSPIGGPGTAVTSSLYMPCTPAITGFTREYRARAIASYSSSTSSVLTLFSTGAPTITVSLASGGVAGVKTATGSWVASPAMDALDGGADGISGYAGTVNWQVREWLIESRYIRA